MTELPLISVITPTLNSEKSIGQCIESIFKQDYPKDKIEIIISDGGSTDKTLEIINSINSTNSISLKILVNTLKTGEAGKALGVKAARGQIAAFIDSDNILPDAGWMKKMVEPFSDQEIIASEPLEYTYRRGDGYITRYCALMGMNDPLCFFLGNYDRLNTITGKWTNIPHKEEDRGNYLKIEFSKGRIPTIGANGFFIRKGILDKQKIEDYLFDIDILYGLWAMGYGLKIAKVKTGIIHIFAGGIGDFMRKQRRRIRDYAYYKKMGLRKYEWVKEGRSGLVKFVLCTVLFVPIVFQALIGYSRKKDKAWFFHIPACVATLFVYSAACMQNFIISRPLNRGGWQHIP